MEPHEIEADKELRKLVDAGEDAVAYHKDALFLDYEVVLNAIKYLVSQGGDIVRSGVMASAIVQGDIDIIQQVFLKQTPNCLHEFDADGRNALMIAAMVDVHNYLEFISEDPVGITLELIGLGADVHQTNAKGEGAWEFAVEMTSQHTDTDQEFYKAAKALGPLLDLLKR